MKIIEGAILVMCFVAVGVVYRPADYSPNTYICRTDLECVLEEQAHGQGERCIIDESDEMHCYEISTD